MSRLFGIAGVQMAVEPWDPDATIDKMADVVKQISRNFSWINMVVFHELVIPGFVHFVTPNQKDNWKQKAEEIPGPLTDRLVDIARSTQKWLIPGSMYEKDGDKIYNTSLVISPEGEIVSKYRKMFPWLPYEAGTEAGEEFCIFKIPDIGIFGLCICYDLWFPEVSRTLAWMGAEVIISPTMTPTSDREIELVLSQANAIFNQCYVLSLNGIGPYGGGKSQIIDPDGRILQRAGDHETIITEIMDLDHVNRTREFGTIGLAQTLKQFRDFKQNFPVYTDQTKGESAFDKLGPLSFHNKLNGIK